MWNGSPEAHNRFNEYNVTYMLREWHMSVNEDFLGQVDQSRLSFSSPLFLTLHSPRGVVLQCCTEVYRSPSSRYVLYKVNRQEASTVPQQA